VVACGKSTHDNGTANVGGGEGVGATYSGAFDGEGKFGTQMAHLTGTFSVCHAANIHDDMP
jgi:hypothetical protein